MKLIIELSDEYIDENAELPTMDDVDDDTLLQELETYMAFSALRLKKDVGCHSLFISDEELEEDDTPKGEQRRDMFRNGLKLLAALFNQESQSMVAVIQQQTERKRRRAWKGD